MSMLMVSGSMRAVASCCFADGGINCYLLATPLPLLGCSLLIHGVYCAVHMRHRERVPLTHGDLS